MAAQAQELVPEGALSPQAAVGTAASALLGTSASAPLGTSFTYQGYLTKDGNPVDGTCDLEFSLYGSPAGFDPIGGPQIKGGVTVSGGHFTVELNGAGEFTNTPFKGEARWLAIQVKCAGDVAYVPLSGRARLSPAPYAMALPGLWTEQNATSPNVIGGHSSNSAGFDQHGTTISGGGASGAFNAAYADFATVGGGQGNWASGGYSTVSGGISNTINGGTYATIGGGQGNAARANGATIGGGYDNSAGAAATVGGGSGNQATGNGSVIGGGYGNIASGDEATVPGGRGAHASLYGQMAYASGQFADAGDAQSSLHVLQKHMFYTSDWENLSIGGSGLLITVQPTRTLAFDGLVVGRSEDGDSAGYYVWGTIENQGGATSLLFGTVMPLGADAGATWDVQVLADDTNDALLIQVKGNGEKILWVGTIRTVEVAWPW